VTKATLPGRDPPQNSDEFKGMHERLKNGSWLSVQTKFKTRLKTITRTMPRGEAKSKQSKFAHINSKLHHPATMQALQPEWRVRYSITLDQRNRNDP
jgi:hypothetical protein